MSAQRNIVSDIWYGKELGAQMIETGGWRRSLDLWRAGRRSELIVTKLERNTFPLALIEGLFGRRRLVLLELQRAPVDGWRARAIRCARPFLARSVSAAQVLSSWEPEVCETMLGIPRERIRFIPWPHPPTKAGPPQRGGYVLASGRAACDWETLFAAARETEWPLVVVCGSHDARRVERLNEDGRARVHVDLAPERHRELVENASVYALVLGEQSVSSGHIRLMEATSAMTPVVATRVRGLVDYMKPGVSALVVDPGDPAALRAGIERVLEDEKLARSLTDQAHELFAQWSMERYRAAIDALVAAADPARR